MEVVAFDLGPQSRRLCGSGFRNDGTPSRGHGKGVKMNNPAIDIGTPSSGDCYRIGIRCRGTPAEQGTSVPSCGRESTPIIGS